jgi:hypothetical protein
LANVLKDVLSHFCRAPLAAAATAAAVVTDAASAAHIAAHTASFLEAYAAVSFSDDALEMLTPPPGVSPPTTLAAEIRKIFHVSDNEAFNRCYDVAGPAAINRWANAAADESSLVGYVEAEVCVQHRLFSPPTNTDNAAYLPAVWAKAGACTRQLSDLP